MNIPALSWHKVLTPQLGSSRKGAPSPPLPFLASPPPCPHLVLPLLPIGYMVGAAAISSLVPLLPSSCLPCPLLAVLLPQHPPPPHLLPFATKCKYVLLVGIQAMKLEELERRLRTDIMQEAIAWAGRVMLHKEVSLPLVLDTPAARQISFEEAATPSTYPKPPVSPPSPSLPTPHPCTSVGSIARLGQP